MRSLAVFFWCLLILGRCNPSQGQAISFTPVDSLTQQQVRELSPQLSLPALNAALYTSHIRLFTTTQVVDFWQTREGHYHGQLVTWTQEVSPDGEAPTQRVHQAVHVLDTATVKILFHLVDSTQVLTLPSETAIAQWKPTFDGISYELVYTDGSGYQVKSYSNPNVQGTLPEAVAIRSFVSRLRALVQAQHYWEAFAPTIPFECYGNRGPSVACHIATAAEHRIYKRERKRYRQQH